MASNQHPASFRDPAGFIFEHDGKFYRQVNQCYADQYNLLKSSGLYDRLQKENRLLAHTELDTCLTDNTDWYKTLLPAQVTFMSYPYEWGFSQWRDAALLTLNLLKTAIQYGMILKDATPFNIYFENGSPVWLDSLSFEKYDATKPWIAYRQYVECFVAPLLLASHRSHELLKLFQLYPDGIPLKMLAKLLPLKSRLNIHVLLHVVLPNSLTAGKKKGPHETVPFTRQKLMHIADDLESFVRSLKSANSEKKWSNYYGETVLSHEYLNEKKDCVKEWLEQLPARSVLDLGTNTGLFAQMAAGIGKFTVAVDADLDCIDALYLDCKQKRVTNLLPLSVDISNPSPAIGWDNKERPAFLTRIKTELCMALAIMHHLVIGKNIGFFQLATTFSQLAPWLIIEFIPKDDPKVVLLLQDREDIFEDYRESSFTEAFSLRFIIEKRKPLHHAGRILFLMRRKDLSLEN